MNKKLIINKTKEFVKSKLGGEGTGHDWWHILRVYKTSVYIGEKENADMFVVELAALLHDIADWKFNDGNSDIGPKLSSDWLKSMGVDEPIINKITNIIRTISFKGGTTNANQETIEGKVVQDADRLDAIGAIGIARAFAYGGYKERELYNPNIKPQKYEDFQQYKNSVDTTVNHFYEKLLLLKDLMNTKSGKSMAKERHRFMEDYLDTFYREWDCIEIE
ncbi:HD domain-containing protein [Clostridium lacusfryxellense]|uniref:HD domain-containing protein n=1 Tax=Clostridium lacusfryxellense TaxID=205328 RepID=UPI001C0B546D|nr:HD domain-containing protein [Clostridium lacusfryxellense]MBU3114399.1 HD domain-containing protein [Clostridium lacusfryxellense]